MDSKKEIVESTLSSLVQTSSELNKLLRKNSPRLNPEHLAVLEQVEKSINKSILTLQDLDLEN